MCRSIKPRILHVLKSNNDGIKLITVLCYISGGQGFFQQPGNSAMTGAQLQQHQAAAGYGLQGFAAAAVAAASHSQSHNSVSFNSQFLSTPMQMAAAISQQYRSTYIKAAAGQPMDQSGAGGGRPQQLKSPAGQDGLSSVFSGE